MVSLIEAKEKVQPQTEYDLAGVRLDGNGIYHRETVRGDSISSKYLTKLQPDALIYGRLFAWRGAFAVVENEHGDLWCSNEFPQFKVNSSLVLPNYLRLWLLTNDTLQLVSRVSVGTSAVSRNRFKEAEFFQFEINLPSLSIQRAIVELWRASQDQVEDARKLLEKPKRHLNDYLHSVTELTPCEQSFVGLTWAEASSWDVKSSRAAAFRRANPKFKPLSAFAEEATEVVNPRLEPEKDWPVYGVNNKEGVFFSYFQKGADFNAGYKRIRKEWFFHNPTRSSVGSLGIVPEVPEDAITSPEYQVWRIREGLLPGFVAVLVTTEYFIKLIQFNRVGAVKQRLYVENLLSIPIPEIPKKLQRKIAGEREAAIHAVKQAKENAKRITAEIEELILGRKTLAA